MCGIKMKIGLLIRRAVRFLTRSNYERSPWMRGLLDAEAGRPLEPYEWCVDERDPYYWQEYSAGARAYYEHKGRRKCKPTPMVGG